MSGYSSVGIRTLFFYCFVGYLALFLSFGCSTSSGTLTDGNGSIRYEESRVMQKSKQTVHATLIGLFQKRAYVVTMSDTFSGLVSGEYYSNSRLPEDQQASVPQTKIDPWLTFLSFVLLIGFVIVIVQMFSSDNKSSDNTSSSESQRKENDSNEHHHYHSDNDKEDTYGYKYVVSAAVRSLSDSTSRVDLNVTQITFVNGSPQGSIAYKSAALNKSIFDALEDEFKIAEGK